MAFVLRMLDSGGYYSSVIVLGELLVASIEDCFIAGVLNDSGLEVVRDMKCLLLIAILIQESIATAN